jgi:hypothetical protein
MPYASGETPLVGDYVKNKCQQPGTVTAVDTAKVGEDHINISWDDGGVERLSAPASEFALLSRQAGKGGPGTI